ncbi:MAG: LytTR family transcriptional regulator DNA-binding domain-containing protein [Oscillospiraceae bacterium]|nr:LytTR family transcriptional regulator DNA-binding domain-containing protein [Oscillospiraceae bacterium]
MEALRIVICDTNPAELERYAAACRAICERKQLPALFAKFSSSQALLFEMLDPAFAAAASILVLEPFNGCEMVAESVRLAGYDGIILYHSWTTKKEYFYQAFDAGAYNYIEKGGAARFDAVFESALDAAARLERHYIFLNCAGEYRQIDLRDISYFEPALNHMICVWYKTGKFLFQDSLSNLEKRLKSHGFVRVHRSYLVSLNAVYRVSFDQVTLVNGKRVPVGRGNYAALKEALDKWGRI